MASFDVHADRTLCALQRSLAAGAYQPGPYALRMVRDPKVRLIAAAPVRDRVVHQAVVCELGPAFESGFIEQSYAGIVARGAHRALFRYLGSTRRYAFRLSLDVRRYFPSIHLPTLRDILFRRVRDPRTRALLGILLDHGKHVYASPLAHAILGLGDAPLPADSGMPIGSYLSQWAGNVYLDAMDHFVKRALKVPEYLRYMDDFSLFADSQSHLEEARARLVEWLMAERKLVLNRKRWDVLPTSAPSIFLGYRVSRAGITASRKLRRRFDERVRHAAAQGPAALARTLSAYRGLLTFG